LTEGIEITCTKNPLQWLIREQPYCLVNLVERKPLAWGKKQFIPLLPNLSYQIRIEFLYYGKPCMPATIGVNVKKGEIQEYKYSTWRNLSVFQNGKVVRTK